MDLYGLGMSGLPPEHQAKFRAMQQQQMMAQAMLAQSQDPLANQAPGVAVSPFQGLAKIAQAYIGAKGMQNANKGYQDIGEKYTADQNSAIAKVQQAMAPTPAVPIPMANANGVQGDMIERPIADKRAAVQEAMLSQFPNVRSFGTSLNANMQADQTREDTQAHRTLEAQLNREQRQHERDLAIEERKRQEIIQAQVREEQRQHQKEMKEAVAKSGSSPFFNFLPGADGYLVGNARTGQLTPAMVNGQPAIKASDSPVLQGQIAGAKTGGEAVAKREFNMTGLGATINEAKSILSGDGGALPTGSGVGAARDAVAGFVGVSTAGSLQAQKLKALSGALTSKMPRMEGPQSDKDVAMYKEMAAEIGNPSVPVERRKAALETVEKLWAQYEPTAKRPSAPASTFDAGKEQRYQAWKKSQGL